MANNRLGRGFAALISDMRELDNPEIASYDENGRFHGLVPVTDPAKMPVETDEAADVIKILEGVVESKWTSPRGDEFAYDIRHANGIVYGNIPGIFVYGSLEALHGAITCNLESAVENADMSVSYYTRHLEAAKRDKARLQRMLQEWRQEIRGCSPDAQVKGSGKC